ncbi:hypothetical protein FE257_002479 [Aspergillus nanangensis]|uniref:Uncharacterized protein n=1 Tax=Aspergillus nanangensis TaxID=2582783 RepID=A0AAD4CTC2_ASPNN|nr:hypothetical protein FE257_002479 [Aspergillus nanangensis]
MHFLPLLSQLLCSLVLIQVSYAAKCGDADGCPSTATCATAILTTTVNNCSPKTTTTTVIACAPTPTCIGVYGSCEFGTGLSCCSGYCAATKCRSTDPKWPNCQEDMGLCLQDSDCCYGNSYGNKCIQGICQRPKPA